MKGISYITDDSNQRQAVVIDLKRHRALWEDFCDYMIAYNRKDEPKTSLNEVIGRLRKAGKIKGDA